MVKYKYLYFLNSGHSRLLHEWIHPAFRSAQFVRQDGVPLDDILTHN